MISLMNFDGHKAAINYDPEIETFWGEFVSLSSEADFYATDIESCVKKVKFLQQCYLRRRACFHPRRLYGGQDFEVALQFEMDDGPFRILFRGDGFQIRPRERSHSAKLPRACSKSAIKSPASSIPTDNRSKPSVMPLCARSSGVRR